jgi:hypothetical protein
MKVTTCQPRDHTMFRATTKYLFALSVLLALLAGCSAATVQPMPRDMLQALSTVTGQDGRACIRVDDIAGYGALNDSVLSVSNRFRKHFLLVTLYRCPEMETSSRALFKGAFTELCGGGRDAVVAGAQRCPVQGVFEFEDRQAAFEAYDAAIETLNAQRDEAAR